jgi:hypothetical protein
MSQTQVISKDEIRARKLQNAMSGMQVEEARRKMKDDEEKKKRFEWLRRKKTSHYRTADHSNPSGPKIRGPLSDTEEEEYNDLRRLGMV